MAIQRVRVIDTHTGGEPTRVILDGGPDLGTGTVAERLRVFREHHDRFRSAVVNEPRGSGVLVGALLVEPADPECRAGVIFFNNTGYLGMCGHGTIGLVTTLARLGRFPSGWQRIETPAGIVQARLEPSGDVKFVNVPSYRYLKDICVSVDGHGPVRGDIAWGGNWFYLVEEHGQVLDLANVATLTDFCLRIRGALRRERITGSDGAEVDHIELLGQPQDKTASRRSFVLCPGGAYDRCPCGTGTSAKLACLYEDGKIRVGEECALESITGSRFEARIRHAGESGTIVAITGRAHITAESELILDSEDPFCWGIPGQAAHA